MKKMIMSLTTAAVVILMTGSTGITVHAGTDLQSQYEKMKAWREKTEKESTEKWLDDLEADGNLTQQAIDAAGKYGKGRVPNHKPTTRKSSGSYTAGGSTASGKGWVYSTDELHVIGLPEGPDGYTKPGYYGDVDGSYASDYSDSGKGWVYSADELHVVGLPEGEDGYTVPGWYGDIE